MWQVLLPLLQTLELIAPSRECRNRLQAAENVSALSDVIRCMYFLQLPSVFEAAISAVATLCGDKRAQARFADAGALWHLLRMLTSFDYTLEEAGVEASAETNAQMLANARAKIAVGALRRLGGFSQA